MAEIGINVELARPGGVLELDVSAEVGGGGDLHDLRAFVNRAPPGCPWGPCQELSGWDLVHNLGEHEWGEVYCRLVALAEEMVVESSLFR